MRNVTLHAPEPSCRDAVSLPHCSAARRVCPSHPAPTVIGFDDEVCRRRYHLSTRVRLDPRFGGKLLDYYDIQDIASGINGDLSGRPRDEQVQKIAGLLNQAFHNNIRNPRMPDNRLAIAAGAYIGAAATGVFAVMLLWP